MTGTLTTDAQQACVAAALLNKETNRLILKLAEQQTAMLLLTVALGSVFILGKAAKAVLTM